MVWIKLHSQSVLLWTKKRLQFPLYSRTWDMPASFLPTISNVNAINSVITLGDSTVEVSNKNRQVMPPELANLLMRLVNGKAIVQKQADTVFSYKNSFLNKANQLSLNKEHPSQDENYFGLNSLDLFCWKWGNP